MIQLFDGAIEQLTRGLAFASRRHALVTENVANLATPGYRAKDLAFEDQLKPGVVGATDDGPALPPLGRFERRPRVVLAQDGAPRGDGNDVNLDRQMARLSQNALYHNTLVQVLVGQFNSMKQAISGRV